MDRASTIRSTVSGTAERFSLWMLRRNADVVFVDNVEVAESLARRGFTEAQVVMTANGFDPLIPIPERVDPGYPLLAFCGRLVEEKGIWDILDLARALSSEVPEARIEMIGDGPMREELARRLAAADVRNTTLLGFVSETEKWALLRRATLFVAPSREEGWGIAVGEALTAGTPVLAYDLPAYRYLGDAIRRVPLGETNAFVAEASRLLVDHGRLSSARAKLESASDRLPQWTEILAGEFDALRRFSGSSGATDGP
jgi:glycosyltransferase involved in cell wall biosynthesis